MLTPHAPDSAQQHTLAADVSIAGVGLFSGRPVNVTLSPAAANHGVRFQRTDLPGADPLPAHVEHAVALPRRTTLKRGDVSVELVEHCLAALAGLGVDNCLVSLDGPELPIGDGSATPFTDAIGRVGVESQGVAREPLCVTQPLTLREGGASIVALPADGEFEVVYALDFGPDSDIPPAAVSVNLNRRPFIEELAPARTFTSKPEAEAARAAGQFEHLSPCDILVFDRGCPVDNDLRFPDEPARHKALDLVGDLALTGRPVRGRFIAHRSGHQLNRDMARALLAQDRARRLADAPLGAAAYLRSTPAATATPSALDAASGHPGADSAFPQGLSIKKIMGLMPHRFPMLLVDRVLEIDANRRAVGVKNVTINEPMFQGHYPNNPIMPGVLVVEAMAQLAGLMLHETLEHDEKIALLLSLERVKLRKPVIPGDQLRLESELVRSNRRSADVHCRSFVEAELAAEARVKFLMVDKAFDRG